MMLSSCEKEGHEIKVMNDDKGYWEECQTCNMRAGLHKPNFKKVQE